jgi:transcriptional regulator with XRE-family HTH domain
MIEREECGRRLKVAREATGLSQTEAAARLEWKQPTLSQYESGARVPSWIVLLEMVEKLGLDPAIVFPEFARPRAKSNR